MKPEPLLIICSDLHLTLKPPACRDDKDWMETQAGYLRQISELAEKLGAGVRAGYDLPVVIAGDIFDRWNPASELLGFAFKYLPKMVFAVPGQHDLPNHREEEMYRSGYGVLDIAERIHNLSYYVERGNRFTLRGFGWGRNIEPLYSDANKLETKEGKCVHIAVAHKFIWDNSSHAYPGVKDDSRVTAFRESLKGYDVAVFGDNHKGFSWKYKGGATVFNCGGFIRRKTDELDYTPRIAVVYSDGSVEPRLLDTKGDRFKDPAKLAEELEIDMESFVKQLEQLGEHGMNFRDIVKRSIESEDIPEPVKALLLKSLE